MTEHHLDADDEKTRAQKEYALQVCVAKQIQGWFPFLRWLHIPNRPGSGSDGHFKKEMGAKAGASDLLVSWRALHGNPNCGYIELKVDTAISSDQNKFLSSWAAIGWKTAVCRSAREVKNALTRWGNKPAHNGCYEPDYRTEQEKFSDSFDFFKP